MITDLMYLLKKVILLCFVGYSSFVFGQDWERIDIGAAPDAYLTSIDFVDEQVGFIVGNSGLLFKTINGGDTWESVSLGHSNNVLDIYFINSSVGFVCDVSGYIYRTVDGGTTWNIVLTPQNVSFDQIYSITFYDDLIGLAVGRGGVFHRTIDGGLTWSRQSIGPFKYLNVSFISENTVLATSGSGVVEGETALSVDGGITWSVTRGAKKTFFDFAKSGDRIFLTGFNYQPVAGQSLTDLSVSTDFGQSFQSVDTDTVSNSTLRSIHFVDSELGYVVGSNGVILKTTDGGEVWVPENSGTSLMINNISNAGEVLFAVGADGLLLKLKTKLTKIVTEESSLLCPNDQIVLQASESLNIHWEATENPGVVLSRDPLFTVNLNTPFRSYTLFEDGTAVDVFQVLERPLESCPIELKVYELITPNGDGVNDTWDIENIEHLISSEVFVYDSWGRKVFNQKKYANTWSGDKLPEGEYVYIVMDLDRNITYKGKLFIKKE